MPGNKIIAPLPPNALRAAEMVEQAVLVEVELSPQDELVLVDEGETYFWEDAVYVAHVVISSSSSSSSSALPPPVSSPSSPSVGHDVPDLESHVWLVYPKLEEDEE